MSQTPWQYDNVYRCKEILKSVCHALAYVTIVNRLRSESETWLSHTSDQIKLEAHVVCLLLQL